MTFPPTGNSSPDDSEGWSAVPPASDTPWGSPAQDPSGQNTYGQNPYGQNTYGQNPSGQNPYGQNTYGPPPVQYPSAQYPPAQYPSAHYPSAQYPPGVYPGSPYGWQTAPSSSGKAIGSLIAGLLSLPASILCFGVLGMVIGIVAVVLGFVARREIRDSGGLTTGDGMALAGIIIGALGVVVSVAVAIFYVFLIVNGNSTDWPASTI